jgi:hypothetical protein
MLDRKTWLMGAEQRRVVVATPIHVHLQRRGFGRRRRRRLDPLAWHACEQGIESKGGRRREKWDDGSRNQKCMAWHGRLLDAAS